jgi:hypothetical protein
MQRKVMFLINLSYLYTTIFSQNFYYYWNLTTAPSGRNMLYIWKYKTDMKSVVSGGRFNTFLIFTEVIALCI